MCLFIFFLNEVSALILGKIITLVSLELSTGFLTSFMTTSYPHLKMFIEKLQTLVSFQSFLLLPQQVQKCEALWNSTYELTSLNNSYGSTYETMLQKSLNGPNKYLSTCFPSSICSRSSRQILRDRCLYGKTCIRKKDS